MLIPANSSSSRPAVQRRSTTAEGQGVEKQRSRVEPDFPLDSAPLLHSFSAHRLTRTSAPCSLLAARCKLDVTGIILFQSKILSGPRAQDELLNLAACGQWELVDELNVSGNLKVRNTSLAKLLELDRSDLRPRFELHRSGNFLPVLVARDSVHGHVAHRRMRSQVFLDLLRVDVLPSTDDHVLDSARDHTIAIRVHDAQIAGS